MQNLLSDVIWGSKIFGYGTGFNGNPAVFIFGLEIFLYALIIVTGMVLAILIGGFLLKKRGIDPYDVCIYAIAAIPIGILGARLYVYIFPWAGNAANWSTFFNFRSGGLGIYGGVILGFLAALVTAKIKKQDFRIVLDCLIPGLLIAQSIGRWGNFANQEAYGPIIQNPAFHWFPFGVEIGGNWHYATFFYESMATLIGFIICLMLFRHKNYRLGWLGAFYGIYYGIVRILVESLRTDSLYLWVGQTQTDIKISQLVSAFTICLGIFTLCKIYAKQIDGFYSKFFTSARQQTDKSRYLLAALLVICTAIAIVLLVLGGESKFIIAVALLLLATYSKISIFALSNRMQMYCKQCGAKNQPQMQQIDQNKIFAIKFVYLAALAVVCFCLAVLFFVLGMTSGVPNDIVLAVILTLCFAALLYEIASKRLHTYFKKQNFAPQVVETTCQCGQKHTQTPNLWLLVLVPYATYPDYSVHHLKEYVEEKKVKNKVNN